LNTAAIRALSRRRIVREAVNHAVFLGELKAKADNVLDEFLGILALLRVVEKKYHNQNSDRPQSLRLMSLARRYRAKKNAFFRAGTYLLLLQVALSVVSAHIRGQLPHPIQVDIVRCNLYRMKEIIYERVNRR
jgi:hypothetical protein